MSCELCNAATGAGIEGPDVRPTPQANGQGRDDVLFRKAGYDIVRCRTCGLVRTAVPRGFAADAIYTEDYFQGRRPDGYFDYLSSETFLAEEYASRLDFVRSYVSTGRLLEVGCATGGFLAHARRHFSVQGVDVSNFAVQAAQAKGLEVECNSIEASTITKPPYDVVVMFDTVEHLPHPGEALARIHSLLSTRGYVFITTGDIGSAMARGLGKRWRLMTPPQHLWFFDRRTIGALLEAVGLRVSDVRYLWRRVPLSLAWYQVVRGKMGPLPFGLGNIVLPVNFHDTMTIVAGKRR